MYKEEPKPPKGGGKKKGAAESVKQEKKDLNKMPGDVKQMDTPARKKGSAKGKGKDKLPSDTGISPLSGKPYAASVTDKQKEADKIKAAAMKSAARKKGGAKHIDGTDKGHKKGAVQKDVMMDENMSGSGKKKGAANYEDGYPPAGSGKKKGASKKKGSADFKGGLHAKNTKHSESGEHLGAKKAGAAMGFTQNFGPARQNSYARGAAKVAKIMGYKGAGDAQGGKPHKHPMDQGSINSMRSQMGDIEGTVGGGGYSNRENYDSFNKTSKTFPKGVIQDYSNLGGAINPAIAKDELQTSLNRTKSGVGGSGTDSYAPFTENTANPSSRAYYSPSNGVQGIDPQTNKSVLYGGQQSNSNKVQAFSSAFQGNMRETIKLRKEGVKVKGLNSKGVVANTELKAPILGASKKPHAKKKKY